MSYIAQHAAPRDTQASPDPYGRIPPTAKPGWPPMATMGALAGPRRPGRGHRGRGAPGRPGRQCRRCQRESLPGLSRPGC
jgi:hypothetical protein